MHQQKQGRRQIKMNVHNKLFKIFKTKRLLQMLYEEENAFALICLRSVKLQLPWGAAGVTHHLAPLLRWSGFPQREDVAADRDFPPQARFRVLVEAVARVHHQNAVGGQSVHLTIRHPPLGRLLLWTSRGFTISRLISYLSGSWIAVNRPRL